MTDPQFLAPVADAPLTATLGETIEYKRQQQESVAGIDDLQPSDAFGWQGLIKSHPYVSLAAAMAVGVTVAVLLRRWWR